MCLEGRLDTENQDGVFFLEVGHEASAFGRGVWNEGQGDCP